MAENRIAVDRMVREGDAIAVEDTSWTVLETPGHSDCSISLHERRAGADDLRRHRLLHAGRRTPGGRTTSPSYAAYVRSIERLAGLEAEVLCLSHNGAICGRRGDPRLLRRRHRRHASSTTSGSWPRRRRASRSGRSPRNSGAEIHGRLPVLPLDFFQKNCGLLVKQSLQHAGITVSK